MIVVDASAVLELLLQTPRADAVSARLFEPRDSIHAPHLLDVEVAQVLRRLVISRRLSHSRAADAISDLESLHIERYPHLPLLRRIWALRDSVTAYDAAYIALAEGLDAPLLTCDRKMARAHGHAAAIELVLQ